MVETETLVDMSSANLSKHINGPNPSSMIRTKSRNGCLTCKSRRLKCDELKPFCHNCLKKKIKCGGYATRFKWRSFNDTNPENISCESEAITCNKRLHSLVLINIPKASNSMTKSSSNGSETVSNKLELGNTRNKCVSSTTETSAPSPNGSPSEALSIQQHLELTSMSILGKLTKKIRLENELLNRGINPNTYYDSNGDNFTPPVKKTRRSQSSNDVPCVNPNHVLQRSHSTSSPHGLEDIIRFRNELRDMNGLHSLSEAAVGEINARTSESTPVFSSSVLSTSASPHFVDANLEKPQLFESAGGADDLISRPAYTSPTTCTKLSLRSPIADLNLTPSLSTVFKFLFSSPDQKILPGLSMGNPGTYESALSPLDLSSSTMSIVGPMSPKVESSWKGRCAKDTAEDLSRGTSSLLSLVGGVLLKETLSPSISGASFSASLLQTSEKEQILYLYSTYTCGIMSIKSGVSENPWRNIYIPLTAKYSYLFNSIASMTLFHLAGNAKLREHGLSLRSKGCSYMKKCILELATGLSKQESGEHSDDCLPADVALATCLNLAVSESWDTHTSSGIAHLKGARSMIQKVIDIIALYSSTHKHNRISASKETQRRKLALVTNEEWSKMEGVDIGNLDPDSSSIHGLYIPRNIQLLFNEWIYFEVLSQMTSYSGHDEKGIDLVATITNAIQSNQMKRNSRDVSLQEAQVSPADSQMLGSTDSLRQEVTFFESLDTMLQDRDCVDPLLGCAQSLFLVMGKVASLISKVRKSQKDGKRQGRNTLSNITLASELKTQLMDWRPSVSTSAAGVREASWDIYSCVSTAEAYRYATLLYLHDAVPEVPLLSSHQLAEKVFVLLASIPSSSNLYIVHIFPLLVSSCEAEPGEEREWCEARWALLSRRIWIGNIDRAFEVVKEVWKRKDEQVLGRNLGLDQNEKGIDSGTNRDISAHVQDVLADMQRNPFSEERGITSNSHWSSVMREWQWEVLLA